MPINIDGTRFTLRGDDSAYAFYVGENGDLLHSHFGGPLSDYPSSAPFIPDGGWLQGPSHAYGRAQREFPDNGNGDFGLPAIRIRHGAGTTVTRFLYDSHKVVQGKGGIKGLPATYGDESSASTLLITLKDDVANLTAVLSYAVFPAHNAFARSFQIQNKGSKNVKVQAAASFSIDMGHALEGRKMLQLSGEWAREAQIVERTIQPGFQGFQSLTGFSSHLHNPFLGITSPSTTETTGDAYGFSLVYTGSFSASVERGPTGLDRVLIGMNPLQLDWTIAPGQTFFSPEAVAVYSNKGLGQMSRHFHRLYRDHLSKSPWTYRDRPVLINNWEATYFEFDEEKIYKIAEQASEIGCSLAVLDDGWFGTKHPRNDDNAGLGDWKVNENKLKGGLNKLVKRIATLQNHRQESIQFGLWVEPEHVNPDSELYEAHPEWTLHAGADGKAYPRVKQRNQYILDLSLVEVQDYLIEAMSNILSLADISYIKWDCNKAIEQLATPSVGHAYILGLYRVIDALTTRFPDVLWEGCASGGGRFDPGLLQYWPGSWTSDCTDPVERLHIQTGTSLVYPPSSMSGHVSASPNHQTGRETPLEFRAHVAMLCGSFGLELDPSSFSDVEREQIPELIRLSERISPYIVQGDLYRLARPEQANWPAFLYVNPTGSGVLLAYQVYNKINTSVPAIRLYGLDRDARYVIDEQEYAGDTLMSSGLRLPWKGDYQSRVLFLDRVQK